MTKYPMTNEMTNNEQGMSRHQVEEACISVARDRSLKLCFLFSLRLRVWHSAIVW